MSDNQEVDNKGSFSFNNNEEKPTSRYISPSNIFTFRLPQSRTPRLNIQVPRKATPLSSTLILASSFACLILLGTILLMLPVSTTSKNITSPVNALFTATSAVCVTGLTVVDTGTYWSTFGQAVLLVLFQIGGLGFIAGATLLLLIIGGKIGLREKLVISESMGIEKLGGIVSIVIKVTAFVFVTEAIGFVSLYLYWLNTGNQVPVWTAAFHTISAFNNCGMDLFGNFQSLQAYRGDTVVILITAFLIIIGSTGYITITESFQKMHWRKFSLETKLILSGTLIITLIGTIFYLITESNNPVTLGTSPFYQKILESFFQTVTTRTAGFSTIDMASLKPISKYFTMVLMFIGGAPGSVAGGLKITTFTILLLTATSTLKGQNNVSIFGRQINYHTVFRAVTLLVAYLLVIGLVTLLLSFTENSAVENLLFETFSALSTVGLSTGITPNLSIIGKIIITATMFIGRLGPLALMAYTVKSERPSEIEFPHENIRIG